MYKLAHLAIEAPSLTVLLLNDLPFDELPLLLVNCLEEKINRDALVIPPQVESYDSILVPTTLKILRLRRSKDVTHPIPHFERRNESMSFDRVTIGKKKIISQKNYNIDEKFSADFIAKQNRFKKNQKNRKAKPKTKMTKRAWTMVGMQNVSSSLPASTINRMLYSSPKFQTIVKNLYT